MRAGRFGRLNRFAPSTMGLLCLSLAVAFGGCGAEGRGTDRASDAVREPSGGLQGTPEGPGGESRVAGGFPVTVTDASGRELVFSSPPERIVSLVPSVTETLVSLGAAERLVGRTEYDTARVVASLPSVGGGLQPALETLLVLEPDLVIRFAGRSDPSTVRRLDAEGIRHLAVRPDGIADVLWSIRQLGRIVDRRQRARHLASTIEAGLDSVRARVGGLPRPRVAFVVGGSPPWVAGPGTFVHEMIRVAGGENVFGDLDELYPVVSPEEFVSREIDVVLAPRDARLEGPLAELPRRRVPQGLQRPGPTLHEGARRLARILHPEAFR